MISRRGFLGALPAAAASLAVVPGSLLASGGNRKVCTHSHPHFIGKGLLAHPEPREGITAENVIPASEIREQGFPDEIVALWAGIAEIPHIADGIACYCGCMMPPMNKRSLLSCYEVDGMARGCEICQGTARLVIGRVKEGQELSRIRAAVDARYG